MEQFVLASESARRVDLLRQAGYAFATRKSGFPEVTLEDPRETVLANARGKALAVAGASPEGASPGAVVLASDTIVYVPPPVPGGPQGQILGQAKDGGGVRRMLGLLSGRVHEVHSGVAIARGGEVSARHAVTEVRMRGLGDADVEAYVGLGEGEGKAGGYAIQGHAAVFVEWIGGDYSNVVGLPLALTARMLADSGVQPAWLAPVVPGGKDRRAG